ncbi:MAG: hypothetical protein AAF770_01085 [Bacteroidota bacterium]
MPFLPPAIIAQEYYYAVYSSSFKTKIMQETRVSTDFFANKPIRADIFTLSAYHAQLNE